MRIIDLRSDTVTLPTDEMLDAIRTAELGDDVSREDPTVNKLEEMAADRFGKEAALLVPSGTAGNLVSVMTHCQRGDEMFCEAEAHVYYYELGGMSAIAGVIPRLIKGQRGVFTPKDLDEAFRGRELHFPNPALVAIENTHNRAGGTCWTPKQVDDVSKKAHQLGMRVHVDGARIFNACVALSVDPKAYAKSVDSLTFCLSKGLSCPVGSLIVGDKEFIEKARKNRKILGGGMRQAGVIAAPGIVALTKMVDRLKDDHDNAKLMANGLVSRCGVKIDMATVQTNIVVADVSPIDAEKYIERARKKGVLLSEFGKHSVRFVTHRGIDEEDAEEVISRLSVRK
ncbi:MAG: aminotransferase class I/II-fold pyridoxal phosphate-dependent enzyme [Methanomassiliicoccales archaeon]|nr:aminotransferase class I/II-fold pyridoxal phosphate-dependent enzyme [Methanomassiliicoccales archaeon]